MLVRVRTVAFFQPETEVAAEELVFAKRHGIDALIIDDSRLDFLESFGSAIESFVFNFSSGDVDELAKAFTDPRYLRFNNQPLVMVAHPDSNSIKRLQSAARRAGAGELFIVCTDPSPIDSANAFIELPTSQANSPSDYAAFAAQQLLSNSTAQGTRRFLCVAPLVDGVDGSSPAHFGAWLMATIQQTLHNSSSNGFNQDLVFIDGSLFSMDSDQRANYLAANDSAILKALETAVPNPDMITGLSAEPRPTLSIAIVAESDPNSVFKTLQSAIENCRGLGKIELVVLDNCSTDGVSALLGELGDDVVSYRSTKKLAAHDAWVKAMDMCSADHILFASVGTTIPHGWLELERMNLDGNPPAEVAVPHTTSDVCQLVRRAR